MRKHLVLVLVAACLCMAGCASLGGGREPAIVKTITGTHTDLRTYAVVVDGSQVLNIRFRYTGTEPEDPQGVRARAARQQFPGKRVDFYYLEIANFTRSRLVIYEQVSSATSYYRDSRGRLKKLPAKTYRLPELRKKWGDDGPELEPREYWTRPDVWVCCDTEDGGACGVSDIYRFRNLDTGKTFAVEIILQGGF